MSISKDVFTITRLSNTENPRVARLALPGRHAIETPHYLANTSRGVVPHLTQDVLSRSTAISGVHISLEDFIERSPPPLYEYGQSLRRFVAIPEDKVLVLGTRRSPAVVAPPATSNTDSAIAVSTSVGFRFVENAEYAQRVEGLDADIVLGMADLPVGRTLSSKRIETATDRSIEWVAHHLRNRRRSKSKYFATLLPVNCANQQYYVDHLVEKHLDDIDGLAIYNLDTLVDLPVELQGLPRIGYTEAATPLQALHHIQRGLDLLVLPFIDLATDAGLAMTFAFRSESPDLPLPLGVNMWDASHASDLSSLVAGCECYACTNHHRAYIQHLLSAKEMLGWVLLQIHNHHTVSLFFAAIRESIVSNTFSPDAEAFARSYEPDFPQKTGIGPRVRGYQRRSEHAAEPKQNPRAYRQFVAPQPRQKAQKPESFSEDFDLSLLDS